MTMTLDEQRIAIAEWVGLCIHPQECRSSETVEDGNSSDTSYHCSKCKKDYIFDSSAKIPNYPLDLNAMHEAEKKLDISQRLTYQINLERFSGLSMQDRMLYWFSGIHSTPQQRSEALCRTLWPERFE